MTPPPEADSTPAITIPADLLPSDGRFGCGPSKVRAEAVAALAAEAPGYLGTSHRQPTVKFMVARLRNAIAHARDSEDPDYVAPDSSEDE